VARKEGVARASVDVGRLYTPEHGVGIENALLGCLCVLVMILGVGGGLHLFYAFRFRLCPMHFHSPTMNEI